jgi:hypothetical protein
MQRRFSSIDPFHHLLVVFETDLAFLGGGENTFAYNPQGTKLPWGVCDSSLWCSGRGYPLKTPPRLFCPAGFLLLKGLPPATVPCHCGCYIAISSSSFSLVFITFSRKATTFFHLPLLLINSCTKVSGNNSQSGLCSRSIHPISHLGQWKTVVLRLAVGTPSILPLAFPFKVLTEATMFRQILAQVKMYSAVSSLYPRPDCASISRLSTHPILPSIWLTCLLWPPSGRTNRPGGQFLKIMKIFISYHIIFISSVIIIS